MISAALYRCDLLVYRPGNTSSRPPLKLASFLVAFRGLGIYNQSRLVARTYNSARGDFAPVVRIGRTDDQYEDQYCDSE